jgi:hypothetical protein
MPIITHQEPENNTVLVCGGRDFDNERYLFRVLDGLHKARPIERIIQGGARGADQLARVWAISRNVLFDTYDADWATHGRKAGPIRNQLMLDEGQPGLVVAFDGGRGTADMLRRAKAAGVDWMACSASGMPLREDPKGLRPKAGSPVPKGDAQ